MKNYLTILLSLVFALNVYCQAKGVEAVGFTVSDMDRSVKFYEEVLDFKKISDQEHVGKDWEDLLGIFGIRVRIVRMQLGEEIIELTDYLTTGGKDIPVTARSNDLIFQHIAIVVSNMDSAYNRLRKFGVAHVSTGPQTLPASIPQAAGIRAFYFQDPDRHNLEIIYYPGDKGQARWHINSKKIFLGIDHTAIGVSQTRKSHQLYQEQLGFQFQGESWNKGSEQSHLNNIENASLHISGYRSHTGPGVEFLEYLYPGVGMLFPGETRSDDIWNWQTTVVVANFDEIYKNLVKSGYRMISKHPVRMAMNKMNFIAAIFRDPDGHAILIKEYR